MRAHRPGKSCWGPCWQLAELLPSAWETPLQCKKKKKDFSLDTMNEMFLMCSYQHEFYELSSFKLKASQHRKEGDGRRVAQAHLCIFDGTPQKHLGWVAVARSPFAQRKQERLGRQTAWWSQQVQKPIPAQLALVEVDWENWQQTHYPCWGAMTGRGREREREVHQRGHQV